MAISKKLEIIYHNGQPDGIRSIRRHLSTMTTYVIPRPLLSEAKKLTGINRPGIYYLISENDDNKIAQIYVGQTRNGVSRLEDHNRSKDFWNKAIMFLATQGYKMENSKITLNETNILHTTRNGIKAFGVYDGEKFEVLEGSEVDMSRRCYSDNVEKQRQTAIRNGDIVCVSSKHKLNVSVSFTSPSSAVIVIPVAIYA